MVDESRPAEHWEHQALSALSEQLSAGGSRFDLVVIGGAALIWLGLIDRATKDVDVVGLVSGTTVITSRPFPTELARAAAQVAVDLGLPADWLNPGPSELLDFGLPEGFLNRAYRVEIGPSLGVVFADRFDQIHFKLYAMVDHSGGRHAEDLRSLDPTPDELVAAARWTITHDPSEGFRSQLVLALGELGVRDANLG